MAGIPTDARHLARTLAYAPFTPEMRVTEEARTLLLNRGIDPDSNWIPPATSTLQQLLKATALFIQLRTWQSASTDESLAAGPSHDSYYGGTADRDRTSVARQPSQELNVAGSPPRTGEPASWMQRLRHKRRNRRISRFVWEARNDFDLLRNRFDRQSFRVSRTLTWLESLGEIRQLFHSQGGKVSAQVKPLDDTIKRIAEGVLADCCEDIGAFHRAACLLAARGALVTESGRGNRFDLLNDLGFKLQDEREPSLYPFLGLAALLLYLGVSLFFFLIPADNTLLNFWALVTVVATNVLGAMGIAIIPKIHWGLANGGLHEKTPLRFVVGAGICALAWATIVNLGAGAALIGGVTGAWQKLVEGAPYLHAAAVTAITMAFLVQDHRWRHVDAPQRRRWRDALTLGTAWLVSSIAGRLLSGAFQEDPHLLEELQRALSSFAFGAVLGSIIPESVRDTAIRVVTRDSRRTPVLHPVNMSVHSDRYKGAQNAVLPSSMEL
jgi:hypothetical protein